MLKEKERIPTSGFDKRMVRKVRRVRVRWERDAKSKEGKWSIIKETTIPRMAILASNEIKSDVPLESISGLWFEATDDDNTVIYRGRIPDPRLDDLEIFDEEGVPSRAKADRTEFIIEILMPDAPVISRINLFKTKPQIRKISRYKLKPIAQLRVRPSSELTKEAGKVGHR